MQTPPQIAQCNRSGYCVANTVWWCAGQTHGPAAIRIQLRANFITSGAGDVRAGILVEGRPLIGVGGDIYSVETADPGFGDFVSKALTWNGGHADVALPSGTPCLFTCLHFAIRGIQICHVYIYLDTDMDRCGYNIL